MKVSKDLGFRGVALACMGYVPASAENEQELARVSFVAAMAKLLVWGIGPKDSKGYSWVNGMSPNRSQIILSASALHTSLDNSERWIDKSKAETGVNDVSKSSD